jgi:hypothetical protein
MTWTLNTKTGELHGPDGNVRATLEAPFRMPDDAQRWAEQEFRKMNMTDLTTDILADYAELWAGDVDMEGN